MRIKRFRNTHRENQNLLNIHKQKLSGVIKKRSNETQIHERKVMKIENENTRIYRKKIIDGINKWKIVKFRKK